MGATNLKSKMIKQFQFLILIALYFPSSVFAQETIVAELKDQKPNELQYSFELGNERYQDLHLHIQQKSIQYFNRSSFISILTLIDAEEVEIGRFYLSEYHAEKDNKNSNFQDQITYDFDVCLWQNTLKKSSQIILKTDGSFEDADIALSFTAVSGVPSVKVKEIIPLWKSDLSGFEYGKNGINANDLPNKNIRIDTDSEYAFIQILVHGIAKSQDPSARFYFLSINGQEIAKRSIWRDDCAYNPIYPQSNNWYESRPNWCPGLRIYPLKHQIPKDILSQQNLDIHLRFQNDYLENSGIYSYVVSAVLFVLEEPEKEVNVAITEILSPNTDKWHQRYNPICGSPVLVIKNLGKENLKQVTFNYGYNFQTDNKFRWKGDLGFMEEEIIYLPPLNWYFFEKDDEPETFTAIISSANKMEDAFPGGKMTSNMELAEVYPYRLTFKLRTDENAIDNALEIFDDSGNAYFLSGDLAADSTYNFEVNFIPGCYEMILFDQKGDGIQEKNEKSPTLEILNQKKDTPLKSFHGNFGGEIREQFMIFR